MTEVLSRNISERMRTGRWKVDERLADWLDEYRSFFREDAKVPTSSHPLMTATRHAMSQIDYAKAQRTSRSHTKNYQPEIVIV